MNVEEIAKRLGGGKEEKTRTGWLTCCPAHEDKTPSLTLSNGNGRLLWNCKAGCSQEDVLAALQSRGLLQANDKKQDNLPGFIWSKSVAAPKKISSYLEVRGIFDAVPTCMRLSSYKDQDMIIAKVSKPQDSDTVAIHRLFVDFTKREKTDAKMLGECKGRGVWFDGFSHDKLIVGEGIETTLSARQAIKIAAVSALSANGMMALEIPDRVKEIFILVDSDPSGTGQVAAKTLANRFKGKAHIIAPCDSCFTDSPEKKDFNDLSPDEIRQRFNGSGYLENVTSVTSVTSGRECHSMPVVTSPLSQVEVTVAGVVRSYVMQSEANVSLTKIYQDLGYMTTRDKESARRAVGRLVEEGILERDPIIRGTYQRCDIVEEEMDLSLTTPPDVPIEYPFRLHKYYRTLQGHIVIIFGSFDAGKTSVLFDILRRVCDTPVRDSILDSFACAQEPSERSPKLVRYINSEMEIPEIQDRLSKMPSSEVIAKNTSFVKRSHLYHKSILPNAINIVDYVTLSDEFYRIGSILDDIQSQLKKGIAIVALQKKRGETAPRGGDFALERCRLAVDLDVNGAYGSIAKIVKLKIPQDDSLYIRGFELDYKINRNNLTITERSPWRIVEGQERKKINDRYRKDADQYGD